MGPNLGHIMGPSHGVCGALDSEQSQVCETKGHRTSMIPHASWGCRALDLG